MARWGLWAASSIGAAAAGAALGLVRRRRPAQDAPPAPPPDVPAEDAGPAAPPAGAAPPEDPGEALDAARERLRARADALRDQIERDGEEPPPAG